MPRTCRKYKCNRPAGPITGLCQPCYRKDWSRGDRVPVEPRSAEDLLLSAGASTEDRRVVERCVRALHVYARDMRERLGSGEVDRSPRDFETPDDIMSGHLPYGEKQRRLLSASVALAKERGLELVPAEERRRRNERNRARRAERRAS